MHEIWKPVLGFEGLYEVSNLGQVNSNETKEKIRARLTGIHKGKRWKTVDGKRVWIERGL